MEMDILLMFNISNTLRDTFAKLEHVNYWKYLEFAEYQKSPEKIKEESQPVVVDLGR